MSDDEWSLFEHFILAIQTRNVRQPTNHRLVLDGIFWISRTGSPWRDLPEEFGKWSSVYRQFRHWTMAGLWEGILEALNQSGAVPNALQMIDSTVIRAHHQATGAKGDSETGFWPFKRWRHDQDPPPRQRAWVAHENRLLTGANFGLLWFLISSSLIICLSRKCYWQIESMMLIAFGKT